MTQVSTGQVTGQQTAGTSLETLPAGAQLRGQVASGAPEGMLRLAVGSARLDVKADVPLPAGTPVLIEVEQAAPEMRLKVSADASALQGRSTPGTGSAPAVADAALQVQQTKASVLAQAAGGSGTGAVPAALAGVTSRPAQASVDLPTFVFLKTESASSQTGNGPSAAAGAPQSSAAASRQSDAKPSTSLAPQEPGGAAVRPIAGAASQAASQAGAPVYPPQTMPSAPSQAAAMAGSSVSVPPSQAAGQASGMADVPAATQAAGPAQQTQPSGAGQTAIPSMAGTPGQAPGPAASAALAPGAAPSAGLPFPASSPQAGMAASAATATGLSAGGLPASGGLGAGPSVAGMASDTAAGPVPAGSQTAASAGSIASPQTPAGAQPLPAGPGSTAAPGAGLTPAGNPPAAFPAAQTASGAAAAVPPGSGQAGFAGATGGQPASPPSAISASSVPRPGGAPAAGAAVTPSAAMANLPPLSGPEAEAELQTLLRGAGPLTARGDAALALDPQALKPVLAEPAQARTVLASLMGTVSKLDVTSLPPAGQKLVEALKGLQADAESLTDPARLRAAVEAVLGLAAGAGGAVAAGLSRKANVPQKADGLTSLLVRLAGLADEVLLSQPSQAGGKKTGQTAAKPQVMQSLDPDAALALAQKTGSEVGERVRLHSASRMAAEYLIRDMAQAAGRGAPQETQAGQSRAASGAGAAAQQSGSAGNSSPAGRPVDISLDLPVLIDGQSRVMSLRISRDPQHAETANDAKGPEWRVRFSMDLPDGGPVEAAAGLRGTSSYVTLRAAEDETLAGFLSRRETLAALFADEGLELEDLRILKAKSETAAAVPQVPLDRSS